MTQRLLTKSIPMSALAIATLAMTSCTDDFERGAKAFLTEYKQGTEITTTATDTSNPYHNIYNNESAYAEPIAVTGSPGMAATNSYAGTSNPTTANTQGVANDYEKGFRAGFDQGFSNGANLEELRELKVLLEKSIASNSQPSPAPMSNPYAAAPAPATPAPAPASTNSFAASTYAAKPSTPSYTPPKPSSSSSNSYKSSNSSSSSSWKKPSYNNSSSSKWKSSSYSRSRSGKK